MLGCTTAFGDLITLSFSANTFSNPFVSQCLGVDAFDARAINLEMFVTNRELPTSASTSGVPTLDVPTNPSTVVDDDRRVPESTDRVIDVRDGAVGLTREAKPTPESGSQPLSRLHHYFEASCDVAPEAVALVAEAGEVTYQDLDALANQLSHRLVRSGIGQGARVGLLLMRSQPMYVALLAVLKAGAAFVPIDPASPADRVSYICNDSSVDLLLTSTQLVDDEWGLSCSVWTLDELDLQDSPRTRLDVQDDRDDPAAYIIYTSGSSGRPKGVEVAQSSICNFINVVPPLYRVGPLDRVYQGMTMAFDFSIEEIWPTWAVGARLVAGPTDGRRLGPDLADFLEEHGVTVLYCVPTVLATIDRDLPNIHTLNVGGEACPQELVERWGSPERLILNTYGPTEATVTCIYTDLVPGRPVMIGHPLPTYTAYLLDEDLRPVPDGETGEICVGGPGVAIGYVGRPDLTAEKFISHPFGEAGRVYRTGDLGRMTQWGIEYQGRADAEVKVRGHRVDLGEIEAQMRLDDLVVDAVVTPVPGTGDLSGFITVKRSDPDLFSRLHSRLRDSLPGYMVPAYLAELDAFPMLPSGKVDRKSLPEPSGSRLVSGLGELVPAETDTEAVVVQLWSEALGVPVDQLSVVADFFMELGGHSLAAASAVSAARRTFPDSWLAVSDLYANPTVRGFAQKVDDTSAAKGPSELRIEDQRHSGFRVSLAGLAQSGLLLVLVFGLVAPVALIYSNSDGRVHPRLMWQLLTWIPIAYLLCRWVLPAVAIPLLSWRLKPGRYKLWSGTHVRVWAIQRLLEISPVETLAGSPFGPKYLRLLGANLGRQIQLSSAQFGLPSMISVGRHASIGYGVDLQPVTVERGWMTIAPISIGEGVFVGSSAHVVGGSEIGRDAVLAEHSLLVSGQSIPPGATWGGSPARPGEHTSSLLAAISKQPTRAQGSHHRELRGLYWTGLFAIEAIPFLAIAPTVFMVWWTLLSYGHLVGLAVTATLSGPVYVASVCLVIAVARGLVVEETPLGVHSVYSRVGAQRWFIDKLLELSLVLTNSLYATLYTAPWLRMLGAKIGRGSEVSTLAHVDPELLVIKNGSFVADMAHIGSAVTHRGYLAMEQTTVDNRAFVGNASFIPAGTTLAPDSLIGVHTVPPRAVEPGSSWLGSPAIYLPKRQESASFDDRLTFTPSRPRVAERLVYEYFRVTAPASLLGTVVYLSLLAVSYLSNLLDWWWVLAVTPVVMLLGSLTTVLLVALAKWIVVGRYRTRVEPLWSRFVRRSELVTGLYEAAAVPVLLSLLVGTPMLGPLMRLFGAKVGQRVYLGTTYLTEFDLVSIGNDATIGAKVSLQTHLFEDRVMKMSTVTIGDGASIDERSVVLYDATVEVGATLGPLSLVMKGESLMAQTDWVGIPARPKHETHQGVSLIQSEKSTS